MSDRAYSLDRVASALSGRVWVASSDFDLNPDHVPDTRLDIKYRPASVLIPVIERQGSARVILTVRSDALKHHAGQVSLPGGKQDAADLTPRAAALREAAEEIGLASDQVQIIGEMASHRTVTSFLVSPFVGLVKPDFRPVADPTEVAEVFEVPLEFLLSTENFQIHGRVWKGQLRRYYAIPYGPYYIWGATARILRALAEQMLDTP